MFFYWRSSRRWNYPTRRVFISLHFSSIKQAAGSFRQGTFKQLTAEKEKEIREKKKKEIKAFRKENSDYI
jgi:hypothetical protein